MPLPEGIMIIRLPRRLVANANWIWASPPALAIASRCLNGTGLTADTAKAREYSKKAAAQGHKEAAAELAKLAAVTQ